MSVFFWECVFLILMEFTAERPERRINRKEGKMIYRIGTRGSRLALAQAESVSEKLKERFPEHDFQLVIVKTTGDRLSEIPMKEVGAKGIFIKELEEHLLSGDIHMAVHSMKDMPVEIPEELTLSAAWEREDTRDVLVLREKTRLSELSHGAVIATGSLRRKYQLLRLRPDLKIIDIRGNVETRLRKLEEQKLDGIVLAAAGLKRLHLEDRITQYFSHDEMIPAPGQGALAIEVAKNRSDIHRLLAPFENEDAQRAVAAERYFLELMGGGCHMPVGAIGRADGKALSLKVMYSDEEGENLSFTEASGRTPQEAAELAASKLGKYFR